MKYLIGVVGENGAGKDTFTTFFTAAAAPATVSKHHFSDVLYDTLNAWGIETTRANLQDLAIIMDRQFGKGSLTRAAKSRISSDGADIVVIEGMRWKTDVPMIRSFKNSYIIYITAEPKIRYERMLKREDKAGESKTNYEQFLREEKAETEIEIPYIGAQADFKIENNGGLDEFRKKVEDFCKQLITHSK
jgi:dephospho-CoA kinase